ncbi:MAG TPA: ribokinase [Pirellulaceae bacterium]|nr:ribokinase [Pirellulaceae bacterium]
MGTVLVFGSSNTDLVLAVSELPLAGQTVLGKHLAEVAGGKGANQAVAAARTGAEVTFVGAVGMDEFGFQARQGLAREGIDLRFVRQVAGVRSGVAMIMVDQSGRNLIGVAPGANACVDADYIRSLPDSLFESADVVVAQLEIPVEAVRVALQRARQSGKTTVLNPAPPDRRIVNEQMLAFVDILVLNEPEAVLLSDWADPAAVSTDGSSFEIGDDWGRLADEFHALGPSAVIITFGERGYRLSAAGQRMIASAHAVPAVDTVGAGDTFVGVLAARLAEGASIIESAHWANAAAALAVTQPGAQPSIPNRDAIETLLMSKGQTSPTRPNG